MFRAKRHLYSHPVPSQLLSDLRNAIRTRNYSIRTEQVYVSWAVRYIRFHGKRHPEELGDAEVVAYLSHLAVKRNVAANTQNQALSALVFLYKHVLGKPLGDLTNAVRAKKPLKLPVVLSRNEVRNVLTELTGTHRLIGALLYGSGLRLMEALQLRIKDVDFGYQCLHIHNAKGARDRIVTFPASLHHAVRIHMEQSRLTHRTDLNSGLGAVSMPAALGRKYPNAATDWGWQYVFPAKGLSYESRSKLRRRHRVGEKQIQRAVKSVGHFGSVLSTRTNAYDLH